MVSLPVPLVTTVQVCMQYWGTWIQKPALFKTKVSMSRIEALYEERISPLRHWQGCLIVNVNRFLQHLVVRLLHGLDMCFWMTWLGVKCWRPSWPCRHCVLFSNVDFSSTAQNFGCGALFSQIGRQFECPNSCIFQLLGWTKVFISCGDVVVMYLLIATGEMALYSPALKWGPVSFVILVMASQQRQVLYVRYTILYIANSMYLMYTSGIVWQLVMIMAPRKGFAFPLRLITLSEAVWDGDL